MVSTGPNTGFRDALDILARLMQRPVVSRDEVEAVIVENCRRGGRRIPEGSSLCRRVERLKRTLERGGVVIHPVSPRNSGESRLEIGWRLGPVVPSAALGMAERPTTPSVVLRLADPPVDQAER